MLEEAPEVINTIEDLEDLICQDKLTGDVRRTFQVSSDLFFSLGKPPYNYNDACYGPKFIILTKYIEKYGVTIMVELITHEEK